MGVEVKDNLLWHYISLTLLPVLNLVWKSLPVPVEQQVLFRGVTLHSLYDLNRFIPNIKDNSALLLRAGRTHYGSLCVFLILIWALLEE